MQVHVEGSKTIENKWSYHRPILKYVCMYIFDGAVHILPSYK